MTTAELVVIDSPAPPALRPDMADRIADAVGNVRDVTAGKLSPASRSTYASQWASLRAWVAANGDYIEAFADATGEGFTVPRFVSPVDPNTLAGIAADLIESGDYRRQMPPPIEPNPADFTADTYGDDDAADEALDVARRDYAEALPYWLARQRRLPELVLPLDPFVVMLHVRDLVDLRTTTDASGNILAGTARCTASTMATRLSAVTAMHKAAGLPSPIADFEPLSNFLTAARRALRSPAVTVTSDASKGEADPVDAGDLRAMIERLPLDTVTGKRDRAMFLLGFAAMMRRSEIAALRVRDVETVDGRLVVTVSASKNHDDARSTGVLAGSNPATCPVRAFAEYVDAAGIADDADGPLFRPADGRAGGINGQTVGRVFTRAARAAAIPGKVSAHSLRRGGASAMYATSRDVVAVTEAGRWAPGSQSVYRYVRSTMAADSAVSLGL